MSIFIKMALMSIFSEYKQKKSFDATVLLKQKPCTEIHKQYNYFTNSNKVFKQTTLVNFTDMLEAVILK